MKVAFIIAEGFFTQRLIKFVLEDVAEWCVKSRDWKDTAFRFDNADFFKSTIVSMNGFVIRNGFGCPWWYYDNRNLIWKRSLTLEYN